jgi:hypothetical protein
MDFWMVVWTVCSQVEKKVEKLVAVMDLVMVARLVVCWEYEKVILKAAK